MLHSQKRRLLRLIPIALIAGILVIFVASVMIFRGLRAQYLASDQYKKDLSVYEVRTVMNKLTKLAIVPSDEKPVVATIINAPILASQSAFYKDAVNGDKVVIFVNNKKAYLYRPNSNVLVNVGPLSVENK